MKSFIRQVLGVWVALFVALATVHSPAVATSYMSDIDIYATSNSTGQRPNVLFVVDNTANWDKGGTFFTREMTQLAATIENIPTDSMNVGIMLFTEAGERGQNGGYVRAAVRPLTESYKTALKNLITTFDVNGDKAAGGVAGLVMAEAWRYYSGSQPYAGTDKDKADFQHNTFNSPDTSNAASKVIYGLSGNALQGASAAAARLASTYTPPADAANNCAGNYIIWISNGASQDNTSISGISSSMLTQAYQQAGLTRPASDITLNPSGSQGNMSDEWARFMKASSLAITTFVLDIDKVTTGQGPGWTALLRSMAAQSGGEYFDVNSTVNNGAQIGAAIGNALNQILARNSVFASASLPVSVNARGSYLNQVFMGMFRPNASAKPRWRGNLKQYKFGYDPMTDTLSLVDANGSQAVTSGTTGFIKPDAVSFWTTSSNFFSNDTMGTPLSASDSPDGEVVEKGGAAQWLRTAYATDQSTRRVYTCMGASCANLADTTNHFTATNITDNSLFGVADNTSRQTLINWVRGAGNVANDDHDKGPGGTVTVRPSIHGDVLHSRPAVVNYGGTPNNIVVFYGANDGKLRAINGNQTATFNGVSAGGEFWAFLPREHFGKLNRQRVNTPEIRLSTTSVLNNAATDPTPRDYFVDGPIGLYQKINANGGSDRVVIYVGMRRGGRALYALDVTNITAPEVLWKVTSPDLRPAGQTWTTLTELGQTWSEPRVARIKGNTNSVVIMGGGYDAAAEDPLTPAASTTMGHRIYVFDAITGEVLKEFATTRSVPGDVSVVDSDYDGYVDRAYAADVHGNVYRIDFEVTGCSPAVVGAGTCGTRKGDWQIRTVASLSTDSIKRKVFYAPDVVLGNGFTAIMVGTGDREKPLCGKDTTDTSSPFYGCRTTNDGFYTLYDTVSGKPAWDYSRTPIPLDSLGVAGSSASQVQGCVIPMSNGEKVINAPLTVGGYTYFSTNKPNNDSASCTGNLGDAKVYGARVFCSGAISETRNGGGMPPSPVSGVVTVSYTDPTTGAETTKQAPFVIGGIRDPNAATLGTTGNDTGCGLAGCKPNITIQSTRTRKYWFVENIR